MDIDIRHVAKLSRLKMEDDKVEKFEKEMKAMIEMVEHLPEISDSGALIDPKKPMIMREDVATKEFRREELLKNAPQVQAGCVVVPKVVE